MGAVAAGSEGGGDEFAGFPLKADLDATAGDEAGDRTCGPGSGEGGQDVNRAVVALEETLGDGGGCAEVAVDLEDPGLAGGWVSKRLGPVECCMSMESDSWAMSPSRRRAQKPMAQARDQPV